MMQVLANPTADIQEGPKVTKAELKARGVRPYDEKVHTVLSPQHCLKAGPCCYTCPHCTSMLKHKEPIELVVSASCHAKSAVVGKAHVSSTCMLCSMS